MNNQRVNMMMAFALSMLVVLGWSFLSNKYLPAPKAQTAAVANANLPTQAAPIVKPRPRDSVLKDSPRIAIETPVLTGSLNLKGAQIDDLVLSHYKQTVDKNSADVMLYAPSGAENTAYAQFGWEGQGGIKTPQADTMWQADGIKLTPATPVTLHWDNGTGQVFTQKIAVDAHYMFTVTQSVTNKGAAPIVLGTYGLVSRTQGAVDKATAQSVVGPLGAFNDKMNYDVTYENLSNEEPGFFARMFGTSAKAGENDFQTKGGWLGFGDKYWLSAVVPAQDAALNAEFLKAGAEYRAGYKTSAAPLAAGATLATTSHLYAGAKEVEMLDGYEKSLGIPHLAGAIDWGWFGVIAKPMYWLIHWLYGAVGNLGIAIIITTFIVRLFMFPVAQRQFASMANMKIVQPKMKALQEKHKDDKVTLQQETMKLYQAEKINPLGGCLPIFLQIPVFFALYKALSLSIDMRHASFLWVKDLSAADPMFFGLTPWLQALLPTIVAIGVLPILNGVTMWAIQKLNPTPITDPAQAQMMKIMPWFMMFMFSQFPAGLALYYVVSNTLTIGQQKLLYARHPGMAAAPAA